MGHPRKERPAGFEEQRRKRRGGSRGIAAQPLRSPACIKEVRICNDQLFTWSSSPSRPQVSTSQTNAPLAPSSCPKTSLQCFSNIETLSVLKMVIYIGSWSHLYCCWPESLTTQATAVLPLASKPSTTMATLAPAPSTITTPFSGSASRIS